MWRLNTFQPTAFKTRQSPSYKQLIPQFPRIFCDFMYIFLTIYKFINKSPSYKLFKSKNILWFLAHFPKNFPNYYDISQTRQEGGQGLYWHACWNFHLLQMSGLPGTWLGRISLWLELQIYFRQCHGCQAHRLGLISLCPPS